MKANPYMALQNMQNMQNMQGLQGMQGMQGMQGLQNMMSGIIPPNMQNNYIPFHKLPFPRNNPM